MHADLTDASVHVPAEVLTPPGTHERGAPTRLAARHPTYDEIADRALELSMRRGGTSGCDLQDWIDAEYQLRTERHRRYAVST